MRIMMALAKEIISGRRLTKEDDLQALLAADLDTLTAGADLIRRQLCGDRAELCSIVNGRGGHCSENCKFCAQSAHHHADCEEYGLLSLEQFTEDCARVARNGVDRYSIVTAGRTMEGEDLEKVIEAYQTMHELYPDMILCASHGLMKEADLERLKAAGVSMYHTNVETSRNYFPQICTTHTYEDKLLQVKRVQAAGLTVCSGGILGMGESWQDRMDMALQLSELGVNSIPLNFLIPIAGTPLEDVQRLEPEEIVRIVAIFRYINPTAYLRIAAGRNYFDDGGRALFQAGANAALTGDMLTTVGNNTAQDRAMLNALGFEIKERKNNERKVMSSKTKEITLIGLMAAVTCVMGPLSIPLPFSPVPISLTNLAVYFSIYVLGMRRGTISYLIYLLIGFVGLPVFSAFTGGPAKLLGPTGGYLIGFIFMAIICGIFVDKWDSRMGLCFIGMVVGTVVCYGFGTLWLAFQANMSFGQALAAGVLPFIAGDSAKIIIAMIIGPQIRKPLRKAGLSES